MAAGVHSPIRVAAALGLFVVAPGVAALPQAPASRPAPVELGLVVGTSLAVSALGAQAMLWLGVWSPSAATWALAGLCLLGLGARAARPRGCR
jgi:hypothetical protein